MKDQFARTINYIRFSITDRCNLRCTYCMPNGVALERHEDLLSYEEFLQVAQAAVELGITRFKVTGGEPLVRRGCVEFLRRLKALPGVEQVTLTTNGVRLAPLAPELAAMGLNGVNISLDAADPTAFANITGVDCYCQVQEGIEAALTAGLKTKLNCVLLPGCEPRLPALAELAAHRGGSLERWPYPRGGLEHPAGPLAGPASCAGGAWKRPCPLLRQFGIARPHWND